MLVLETWNLLHTLGASIGTFFKLKLELDHDLVWKAKPYQAWGLFFGCNLNFDLGLCKLYPCFWHVQSIQFHPSNFLTYRLVLETLNLVHTLGGWGGGLHSSFFCKKILAQLELVPTINGLTWIWMFCSFTRNLVVTLGGSFAIF